MWDEGAADPSGSACVLSWGRVLGWLLAGCWTAIGTGLRYVELQFAGVIQLVECQLPKLDVAGSSPVARSRRSRHIKGSPPGEPFSSGGEASTTSPR